MCRKLKRLVRKWKRKTKKGREFEARRAAIKDLPNRIREYAFAYGEWATALVLNEQRKKYGLSVDAHMLKAYESKKETRFAQLKVSDDAVFTSNLLGNQPVDNESQEWRDVQDHMRTHECNVKW